MPETGEFHGIVVRGHGETFAEPDTAFIDVGVQVLAPTVAEARERGAAVASLVIEAVKAAGVSDRDIATSNLSVSPHYEQPRQGTAKLTGYDLSNTVTVRLRHIEMVSRVVDEAIAAGGDDVRLDGLRFTREEMTDLIDQARSNAMADARDRATQLARLAGVKLGRPLSIVEGAMGPGRPEPRMMMTMAADAGGAPTPIEPGITRITVDLQVRYAIDA